ncbi:MAG: hypothetical protein LW832_06410 [Parachlamydia sp.]|nr:hypothetical protein [Parachlamydia sp.]
MKQKKEGSEVLLNALIANVLLGSLSLQNGIESFRRSHYEKAKAEFEAIQEYPPETFSLAQIYLGRLAAGEGNRQELLKHLRMIEKSLPSGHPLFYQKHFLDGIYFYQGDEHAQAIACFKKALTPHLSEWKQETLAYLTKSLLKQAIRCDEPAPFFKQAEEATQALLSLSPHMHQQCLDEINAVKNRQLPCDCSLPEGLLLKEKGIMFAKKEAWQEAKEHIAQCLPLLKDSSEALYWLAVAEGNLGNETARQKHLKDLYTNFPHSPYAPIACFNYFPLQHYALGRKQAIRHLKNMHQLFPEHPGNIQAFYLLGLSQLKDPIAAIDFFQRAEDLFELLFDSLSEEELPYYKDICTLAILEKGRANRSISTKAGAAKKEIYLTYSQSIYEKLLESSPAPPALLHLAQFELACIYKQRGEIEKAESLLNQLMQLDDSSHIKSKAFVEKGKILQQRSEDEKALQCFILAEKLGKSFSPDQKLETLLDQSECHKALKQYDLALLVLSKAVNDESISSLRIKAMFLRAEIYLLQQRPELAIKQLESIALKGGEWGKQARNRLKELYG